MASEAQAAALGVAQAQALDRRDVLARRLATHAEWPAAARVAISGSPRSVGPTWMLVPI